MKTFKEHPDAGFSLLEVVVGIIMVFFFTTVALQMIVFSSIFRQKAAQYTNAINLIQQDLERVRSGADQYSFRQVDLSSSSLSFPTTTIPLVAVSSGTANVPLNTNDTVQFNNSSQAYRVSSISGNTVTLSSSYTPPTTVTISANAAVNASTLTLSSVSSLSTNHLLSIGSQRYRITNINTSTGVVTITPNLVAAVSVGATAYVLPSSLFLAENANCNPSAATSGIATLFINDIGTAATSTGTTYGSYKAVTGTPTQVNNQFYWLLRQETVSTSSPHNILQVNYVVYPGTSSAPTTTATALATVYTEVIPYASLQCPSL
jgi:type II secretory pathway pseudopilin PulG